ncbi:transposase, partial [Acinetobacter baumannii]|uniref:IS66 family transposase n=1 Tax=Acinetobacter baumannii TaxID=470 RepID=UPI0031F47458
YLWLGVGFHGSFKLRHFSTSSINRWMHDTIDLLYPLYFCQMNKVMESSVLHIDETTIPINDKPGKTRKGYI